MVSSDYHPMPDTVTALIFPSHFKYTPTDSPVWEFLYSSNELT